MDKLEKLIRDIRRQMSPYQHEHDVSRDGERWKVEREEYLSSWIVELLKNCRKRNKCGKRRRCIYYGYRDLSQQNYEICYEFRLRLESGDIGCRTGGGEEGEA